MQANQQNILKWIGLSEGGYVNHPKDPGGATDRGITQDTYDSWNRLRGYKKKPVKGISKAEAEEILVSQYFTPIRFNDLPSGLDYAVADYSVNSGPSRAAKALQRLVGVTDDGIIGSNTLAAVAKVPVATLIAKYCNSRLAFLKRLSTWKTFGRGWTTRVENVKFTALDMASGSEPAKVPVYAAVDVGSAKGVDADITNVSWTKKALNEPATWIPVAGGILSGVVEGQGPIQYALAAIVVLGAIYAAVRLLKKDAV